MNIDFEEIINTFFLIPHPNSITIKTTMNERKEKREKEKKKRKKYQFIINFYLYFL